MKTRDEINKIVCDALAARLDENGYQIEKSETVKSIALDFIESSGDQGVPLSKLVYAFNKALKKRGTPLPLQ